MRTTLWIACLLACGGAFAQPESLDGAAFTVTLTETGRVVPISLPYPYPEPGDGPWMATGKARFPIAYAEGRMFGTLPAGLPVGSHRFVIRKQNEKTEAVVEIDGTTENDTEIRTVRVNGDVVTAIRFNKEDRKPYLWPLFGEGGASLTRDYPFVEGGKTKDHPHHVSFWTAHGDLNGADYWEYGERTGWQRIERAGVRAGQAVGAIELHNVWENKDHDPVVKEERTYRFYASPADRRIFDVEVKFTAAYGDVTFGDTKEGGIVGLRMNDDLREQGGTGKITTSEGAVGEKAAWGKAAAWCDYTGTLDGFGVRGITVMNHPSSFRYPIRWHVRAYGLLGANAFGYSDFTGGKENGEYTLKNGESIEFKFRIYLHSGDVESADVAGYFKDYANPPAAEWVK